MLKVISLFQIVGGIIGILFVTSIFIKNAESGPLVLVGFFSICFYVYSLYCGITLLKPSKKSFKHTTVNLSLQIMHISIPKFSFEYVSGLSIKLGISFNNTTSIDFGLGLSVFKFAFNEEMHNHLIGINLVALFFLYQVKKLHEANQDEIQF
jgi:hypothetical protein